MATAHSGVSNATPERDTYAGRAAQMVWQLSTVAFIALSIAVICWSIFTIYSEAIYLPWWDQWDWFRQYLAPERSFRRMATTPVNGHILFVPALVFYLDVALSSARNVVNLTTTLICIASICLILRYVFLQLSVSVTSRTANIFFLLTVLSMLWFNNWENVFWPFQVHSYLSMLFMVIGLLVLSRAVLDRDDGPRHGKIAALLGVMATLSFGAGFAFWPMSVVIALLGSWPTRWKSTFVALVCVFVLPALLWIERETVSGAGTIDIVSSINFIALYLGSPFFFGGNDRTVPTEAGSLFPILGVGYVGICLAGAILLQIIRVRRKRLCTRAELFFVGLLLFSLLFGVMAARVRMTLYVGLPALALGSRYCLFSLMFWVAATIST